MNKDVQQLVRQILAIDGVEVTQGTSHLRVAHQGKYITTLPKTPSDRRWLENAKASLRRGGITPGSKVAASVENIPDDITDEQLREAIAKIIRIRGNQAALARFTFEVAQAFDIKSYKTVSSAETSIYEFVKGGGVTQGKRTLLAETVRMWRARQASMHRASRSRTATDGHGNNGEVQAGIQGPPEVPVVTEGQGKLTFVLDLEVVNGFLSRFGLEVRP